jgi:hypothetical protein
MIETIDVVKTIHVPGAKAWAAIRAIGGLERWFSAIATCRVDDEGAGAIRTLGLADGGEIEDRIVEIDDSARRFRYQRFRHPFPVASYQGKVVVREITDSDCEVTWSVEIDVEAAAREDMIAFLRGALSDGISGLADDLHSPDAEIVPAWRAAIAACGEGLRQSAIMEIPADSPGWIDSGVVVDPGEWVTLLAVGEAKAPGDPPIGFPANLFLWRRIGPKGRIEKFAARTSTFRADAAGSIMLVAQYPGAWHDETGTFDPAWPRDAVSGSYTVAILVWRPSADDGLALFAAHDTSGLGQEARIDSSASSDLPAGWRPLWRTGASRVYHRRFEASEASHILCRCAADAAIIEYPTDVGLEPTTRLAWQWRVIELPSRTAEREATTHDYLSIAIAFDNGLDLTYMWSSSLPVGTSFRCPLPWWDKHETHQVVRSGAADLGRWLDEERPILEDYRAAIGGQPPSRIVGVWLIAVAAFQKRRGECEYRSIRLSGGGAPVVIGA